MTQPKSGDVRMKLLSSSSHVTASDTRPASYLSGMAEHDRHPAGANTLDETASQNRHVWHVGNGWRSLMWSLRVVGCRVSVIGFRGTGGLGLPPTPAAEHVPPPR